MTVVVVAARELWRSCMGDAVVFAVDGDSESICTLDVRIRRD